MSAKVDDLINAMALLDEDEQAEFFSRVAEIEPDDVTASSDRLWFLREDDTPEATKQSLDDQVLNAIMNLTDEQQLALIGQIAYMDDGFWKPSGEPMEPLNRLRDAINFANHLPSASDESSIAFGVPGPQTSAPAEQTDVLDGQIEYRLTAWGCFEISVRVDGPGLRTLLESVVMLGKKDDYGAFVFNFFDGSSEDRPGYLRREVVMEYFKAPLEDVMAIWLDQAGHSNSPTTQRAAQLR